MSILFKVTIVLLEMGLGLLATYALGFIPDIFVRFGLFCCLSGASCFVILIIVIKVESIVQWIIDRFGKVFERPQRTNEIEIPAKYARKTPSMFLSEIIIIVSQRFSTRTVWVSNHKGKYRIYYEMDTHMPPPEDGDSYSRVLSAAEAVWLEKQVKKTIRRLDSTWHSRCGGDSMYVAIERNKGRAISCRALSSNYSHLQYELGRLAQFGSYIKE